MKFVTVVGARPQFIKAAMVSRILRQRASEILVHTGQHYDHNMSDIFFDELDIPKPDYHLGISSGSHGKMTGSMLVAIEEILIKEKPEAALIYGDTNSTLSAALAAVKLNIPICHVEAGVRLGTLTNPEEVNRICADHLSNLLLYCTISAEKNLQKEGLFERSKLVGDPMYDAFVYYGERLADRDRLNILDFSGNRITIPESFYYLTCHRQENTDTDIKLTEILIAMNSLDAPVIYPVHPRNRKRVRKICEANHWTNVILTHPVGYFTSIALVKRAKKIITDSGGLQREAFFAGVQCVTVFDYVIWPETMVNKRNQLSRAVASEILDRLTDKQNIDPAYQPFGDAHAGEKIVKEIVNIK
jgi:UDP-N-acetylglucosamine 2-epimerase